MRLSVLLDEYAARTLIVEKTRRLHATVIRHFSRMLLRPAEIADLSDDNLARYAAWRMQKKRAAASIAGEQAKLMALWRHAARMGYVTQWPTIHTVRVPERIPLAWTREELGRLFAATRHARKVGTIDGTLWWSCLFYVLWESGERITATMAIEWPWVDLRGRTILIPAEARKGRAKDRMYPISEQTAELLGRLPRMTEHVFYWPYHIETLFNRLKRMLVLEGLPADRRSKFHRIRRSTASHFEAAGGNATELLGHTSRKVTRTYLDPRVVKPISAVDLLFRPGYDPGHG